MKQTKLIAICLCLSCLAAQAQNTAEERQSFIQKLTGTFINEMPTETGTIIFDKILEKKTVNGLLCYIIQRQSSDRELSGVFLEFASLAQSSVLSVKEAQGLLDAMKWMRISCSPGATEGRYYIEDKVSLSTYRDHGYMFMLETAGCRTPLDGRMLDELQDFLDETITIGESAGGPVYW